MKALSFLSNLWEGCWPSAEAPLGPIRGARGTYVPQRLVASGDVADIYLAQRDGDAGSGYLLKVSSNPDGHPLLDREAQALTNLLTAAADTTYRKYLPELIETFTLTGPRSQRVNVFRAEPGWFTLEMVHRQHPSLEGRHLAWIFKRLLTVLGFGHRQDVIHGAVLPGHVLVHAGNHGLRLIGWGHRVRKGQAIRIISEPYEGWYPPEVWQKGAALPATDLFLAAQCISYLAGGQPERDPLPESMPIAMRRFLQSCLLESPRMRPDDAWALFDEWDELLRQLYGPPRFHELVMSEP